MARKSTSREASVLATVQAGRRVANGWWQPFEMNPRKTVGKSEKR